MSPQPSTSQQPREFWFSPAEPRQPIQCWSAVPKRPKPKPGEIGYCIAMCTNPAIQAGGTTGSLGTMIGVWFGPKGAAVGAIIGFFAGAIPTFKLCFHHCRTEGIEATGGILYGSEDRVSDYSNMPLPGSYDPISDKKYPPLKR